MLKMSIIKTLYSFTVFNCLISNDTSFVVNVLKVALMKTYPYDAPIMSNDNRIATQMNIEYAKAKIPEDLPRAERLAVEDNIKQLLKDNNAV